jgi:pyridoxine 4-dehydrogenase
MTTVDTHISLQLTVGRDMTVNRIGYGAMHLTGPGMWGDPDDMEGAVRVLRRAVDLGINFIDTADSYGPGNNERVIRRALHPYPKDLVISTKGGMLRSGPKDWIHGEPGAPYIMPLGRPEYLRQQVVMSLRNLGVECIDLYQLHSIDPTVPLADQLGELVRLKEQGKIRHIGLSGQPGVTIDQLIEARAITDIVAIENLYNIADRADEKTLRYAEQHNVAFIPWFPLGHGGLVGPDSVLNPIAEQYGATPSQLALAWLLHRSPATILIPGTTSFTHLEENVRAANIKLSAADMAAITAAVDRANPPTWRPDPASSRQPPKKGVTTTPGKHPNTETLRTIYADLSCIDRYVADDVVLHTADRGASGRPPQVVGKKAVLDKELELIRMTDNTLAMDVENITANDHFGAVMGKLRSRRSDGSDIAMPFCGLWRFRNGRIIEHWENAYDAAEFGRFLMGETTSAVT